MSTEVDVSFTEDDQSQISGASLNLQLLREALHGRETPRTGTLAGLSDLGSDQIAQLQPLWWGAPANRRRLVLSRLRELAEENVEYNFKSVFLLALADADPESRTAAVDGLWEEESSIVLQRLEVVLLGDRSPEVRACAATALGRFAYRAAVGDLSLLVSEHLHELLRRELNEASDGTEMQMRLLETLSYFAADPLVAEYIGRLYREGGEEEQASAIVAMGRSMDPRWRGAVIQELDSDSPRLRFYAAHAAGEMRAPESVPVLRRLLDEDDAEIRHSAVWALGQIGNQPATEVLKAVITNGSDDMREAAEVALDEALYSGEL